MLRVFYISILTVFLSFITSRAYADVVEANDDIATVCEDTLITIDVLANDVGSNLFIQITVAPLHGIAQDLATEEIRYTPNPNFSGLDSLKYLTSDGTDFSEAWVYITVVPKQDPPTAINDTICINEDSTVIINVQANDFDIDAPVNDIDETILDFSMFGSNSPNGTLMVDVNALNIIYTPDQDFFGLDSFTYVLTDNGVPSLTDTAWVFITVKPINDKPEIIDEPVRDTTDEDVAVIVEVEVNEVDGDSTFISTVYGNTNGTVVINNDGTFTYTPDTDFNGNDTMFVVVCDTATIPLCDTAEVIIVVEPVNDAPIIIDNDDTIRVTTVEDTDITIEVEATDIEGDSTFIDEIFGVTNGTVVINSDSTFTYTPDPDFVGNDTINVVVCDNGLPKQCDTTQVIITVTPVNDPPVLNGGNDTLTVATDEDIPVQICIDIDDAENDPFGIFEVSGASNGTIAVDNDSCMTYTPDPDFNGNDTIVVVVCDSVPAPNQGCDTLTIVVVVNPVNDSPVAEDDTVSVGTNTPTIIDVQGNDFDVDGDTLFTTIIQNPSNGTVTVLNGDSIVYTPDTDFNGNDTLIYIVCDNSMPQLCDTAMVIITVTENKPPIAVDDNVDATFDAETVIPVLVNDSDPNGDDLSVGVSVEPNHGTVTVNSDGTITYDNNGDFENVDSFQYYICDGGNPNLCDSAWVYINVTDIGIHVPNSISPNGDNVNDIFHISGLEHYPDNKVLIFNRWGDVVFEQDNYTNDWQGTANKSDKLTFGEEVPDGVYFYKVYIVELDQMFSGYTWIKRK